MVYHLFILDLCNHAFVTLFHSHSIQEIKVNGQQHLCEHRSNTLHQHHLIYNILDEQS